MLTYIHTHSLSHAHTQTRTHKPTRTPEHNKHKRTHTYTHIHTHTLRLSHTYTHIKTHTYTHTHTHEHTHTHTHIETQKHTHAHTHELHSKHTKHKNRVRCDLSVREIRGQKILYVESRAINLNIILDNIKSHFPAIFVGQEVGGSACRSRMRRSCDRTFSVRVRTAAFVLFFGLSTAGCPSAGI